MLKLQCKLTCLASASSCNNLPCLFHRRSSMTHSPSCSKLSNGSLASNNMRVIYEDSAVDISHTPTEKLDLTGVTANNSQILGKYVPDNGSNGHSTGVNSVNNTGTTHIFSVNVDNSSNHSDVDSKQNLEVTTYGNDSDSEKEISPKHIVSVSVHDTK